MYTTHGPSDRSMHGNGVHEQEAAWRAQRGSSVTSEGITAKIKRNKFYKTTLCTFGPAACKWGSKCHFAHSEDELVPKPDLSNTKLCPAFVQAGTCSAGRECPFAHDPGSLRKGAQRPPASVDNGSAERLLSGLQHLDTLELLVHGSFSGEGISFSSHSMAVCKLPPDDPCRAPLAFLDEPPMPRFLENAGLCLELRPRPSPRPLAGNEPSQPAAVWL